MDTLRTEEEQIAALKNWWKTNGNSLLIGIGSALLIVFGWKAYQNSEIQERTEASMLYQQLISVATQPEGFAEEEGGTVSYLAEEIKTKFDNSEYAIYGALFLAKEAVKENKLDDALVQLEWVESQTEDSRLKHIVNGRIARVLSAQGKHEDALTLLEATDPAFEASYLEITGDIKRRIGDDAAAVEAYKKAFDLVKETPQSQPMLAVKLSDLGINPENL